MGRFCLPLGVVAGGSGARCSGYSGSRARHKEAPTPLKEFFVAWRTPPEAVVPNGQFGCGFVTKFAQFRP
jgi:hypothetical protein